MFQIYGNVVDFGKKKNRNRYIFFFSRRNEKILRILIFFSADAVSAWCFYLESEHAKMYNLKSKAREKSINSYVYSQSLRKKVKWKETESQIAIHFITFWLSLNTERRKKKKHKILT